MDEFVSSHGFEFIDGDNDSRTRALDLDDDSIGEIFHPTRNPHTPSPVTSVPTSVTWTLGIAAAPRLMLGFLGF